MQLRLSWGMPGAAVHIKHLQLLSHIIALLPVETWATYHALRDNMDVCVFQIKKNQLEIRNQRQSVRQSIVTVVVEMPTKVKRTRGV